MEIIPHILFHVGNSQCHVYHPQSSPFY
jgi:hypothetical protein